MLLSALKHCKEENLSAEQEYGLLMTLFGIKTFTFVNVMFYDCP